MPAEMGINMNYAEIKYCDIANGPGVRTSLFVSGCTHHCPGCFNEIAWDFEYGKPFTQETIDAILASLEPGYIAGLTLLGGEPFEAEINLTLTDNDGIHAINKEYRDIDAPTDVLSFPMLSYESAGDFSKLEDDYDDNFNPDTGEIMLGDIIISVDKVKEQAKSYGHSEKREYAFLILHSMLHYLDMTI